MGISASSELGRAILRKRPDLLASTAKAEREAKREALTCYGYTFRSKAELSYAHRLEGERLAASASNEFGVVEWKYEATTFTLSDKRSFTVDFTLMMGRRHPLRPEHNRTDYHEVKAGRRGHLHEREGLIKLEWAAARHPESRFFLARLNRTTWTVAEVPGKYQRLCLEKVRP